VLVSALGDARVLNPVRSARGDLEFLDTLIEDGDQNAPRLSTKIALQEPRCCSVAEIVDALIFITFLLTATLPAAGPSRSSSGQARRHDQQAAAHRRTGDGSVVQA
jgi:hypothetical protein